MRQKASFVHSLKMEEKMTLSLYTSKPENSSSAWLQFFENQTTSVIQSPFLQPSGLLSDSICGCRCVYFHPFAGGHAGFFLETGVETGVGRKARLPADAFDG